MQGIGVDVRERHVLSNLNVASAAIIGEDTLARDCIARWLGEEIGGVVTKFTGIQNLGISPDFVGARLIVIIGMNWMEKPAEYDSLKEILHSSPQTAVAVIDDDFLLPQIVKGLESGVKGFIPAKAAAKLARDAINLIMSGGQYIPASCLLGAGRLPVENSIRIEEKSQSFTPRENAIIEALRQGKSNKWIAHDLHLSESTVKVHVHNIMRKLNAKNRTEAVIKIIEALRRSL
jgi:DNA-binding NarL/FixJ family response regulator